MVTASIQQSSRIFPAINPQLHTPGMLSSSLTANQHLGRAVMALSEKRFSMLGRWRGWGLDAAGKVGRLLLFHRLALESELAAQIKRADFFWREAHAQLRDLCEQAGVWEAILKSLFEAQATSLQSAPERLLHAIASEIFLETHQAFFHGLSLSLEVPPADHRSYAHLDYIRDMVDVAGLSKTEQRETLVLATIKEIAAYQEKLQWKRAEQLSVDLLRRFPDLDSCQATYANLIFVRTVSSLKKDSSEAQSLRNARSLQRGIDRLKKLRQDYPHNLVMLELIGHLYYLRSVKLANARRLAHALADVQAAVTYDPNLTEALETREKLDAMMQDLRVQLSEAAAKIGQEPKAALSIKGMRMKREAARGFRLMDAFKQSEEARLVSDDALAAQARKVWQEIRLGPLERLDLRPLGLHNALQGICRNPPSLVSEIPAAWQQAASDDSELCKLDGARICAYLARCLFAGEAEAAAERSSNGPASVDERPSLIPASAPRRLKSEPFGYWLFSSQGLRLKLQCVISILLLAIAGGLAAREYLHRQSRAVAYHEIYLAKDAQDFQRTVEQAEKYLSNPILGPDSHEDEVKSLYSEALVRWVASQSATPEQTDLHARRYRALVLGISEGE